MDKYGVTLSEEVIKEASVKCPECGLTLIVTGNLVKCPVHGTEPFEYEDNDS
jgi:uncharacterized Zn finger protein (UPF0148 family)